MKINVNKSTTSVRDYGFVLSVFAGIFALFIVFAWKNEEDRKDFLSGWISGIIIPLIIIAAIILFVIYAKTNIL